MNFCQKLFFVVMGLLLACEVYASEYERAVSRAEGVQSKLDALNGAGMRCSIHVDALGMRGAERDECKLYLNNIKGQYFKDVMAECVSLTEWNNAEKRKVKANPKYPNEQDLKSLVKAMKLINHACDTDSYSAQYPYLVKPLKNLKALSELN